MNSIEIEGRTFSLAPLKVKQLKPLLDQGLTSLPPAEMCSRLLDACALSIANAAADASEEAFRAAKDAVAELTVGGMQQLVFSVLSVSGIPMGAGGVN